MQKSCWIVFLCLAVISCLDQPDCYNLNNNSAGISFRKISDGALDTVVVLSSDIIGLETDLTDTIITGVTIPVDFSTNTMSFSITDVLKQRGVTINYNVQTQFVSEECGPRFFLSGLNANSTTGDSVRVLASVLGGGVSHVGIYRCPRTNIVRVAFKQVVDGKEVRDTASIINTDADDLAAYVPVQFYKVTGKLSSINLPLDVNADESIFTFELEGGVTKTMAFTYEREEKIRYQVCGTQTFIKNLQLVSDFGTVQPIVSKKYVSDSIYDPPKINFAIFQ